ncbi:MAG: arginine N-succinyltransferase [Gammaproteobacteria bacterium]|nr:arginine N-succinyltransferase [Gammaproteobacteria bacterium]
MNDIQPIAPPPAKPAGNPWRTFGIIVITVAVTLGIAWWVVTAYLFPTAFTPVTLNQKEQQRLNQKLGRLGITLAGETPLAPEPYRETDASRDISFSEKELNALIAHNTDLASKLAIDLSDNLASAKLLVKLDPDMPFFGGKTLKVTAGLELHIKQGHPRAVLKGVSVWGVPLPNAWLGNMKNIDLIQEFGDAGGFWQAIKDGVEELEIKDGELHVILKK